MVHIIKINELKVKGKNKMDIILRKIKVKIIQLLLLMPHVLEAKLMYFRDCTDIQCKEPTNKKHKNKKTRKNSNNPSISFETQKTSSL